MTPSMTERFEMRLDEETLEKVDKWRGDQGDVPSRAEAMRRLVEIGLGRAGGDTIAITDGEKLIMLMMRDLYKQLKVKGDINPDFVGEVLWGGHTWALKWQMSGLYHGHEDDYRDVRLVLDVLAMWDHLERGYEKLSKKDKERVAKEAAPLGTDVQFPGFDGNDESTHLSIAHFLVEEMNRFSRFKDRGEDLNSHAPLIDSYRRMLVVYEKEKPSLQMGGEFSAGQIIALLNAQRYPGSRGK